MKNTESELVYKILLLGDSEVGKSCFLMRYSDNIFVENYITTIGLDYKLKYVQLDSGETLKSNYGIQLAKIDIGLLPKIIIKALMEFYYYMMLRKKILLKI